MRAALMFVLLEHQTDSGVHWDLMIETTGRDRLATWRLARNPIALPDEAIAAEPIGDHRRVYLDYEGELSDGRGRVERVDGGESQIIEQSANRLVMRLDGRELRGRFEVGEHSAEQSMFRRV